MRGIFFSPCLQAEPGRNPRSKLGFFLPFRSRLQPASFSVPLYRQGPEPNALRALFLFLREMPAFIAGIFLVHVLQTLPGAERALGFFYFNKGYTSFNVFFVPVFIKRNPFS